MLFIFVIAMLVLGPAKLLDTARGMGKLIRQFRRLSEEWPRMLEEEAKSHEPPPEQPEDPGPGEGFQRSKGDEP